MPSMFCDIDLAARIERAESGSPFNKVAGLGFQGWPGEDAWETVGRAMAAVGGGIPVELAQLADPAVLAALTQRGYRLQGFENVLGRTPHRTGRQGPTGSRFSPMWALNCGSTPSWTGFSGPTATGQPMRDSAAGRRCGPESQENLQRHGFDLLYTRAILGGPVAA